MPYIERSNRGRRHLLAPLPSLWPLEYLNPLGGIKIDPARSPKVHVPALNHVGLWVDDLAAAVNWLSDAGVRFTPGGVREGASGHDVCFIHPKGNDASPVGGVGVLIELVQAPQNVIAAFRDQETG